MFITCAACVDIKLLKKVKKSEKIQEKVKERS